MAQRGARSISAALRWPALDLWPILLVGCVLAGCAWALGAAEIGSGDYGQWLMTARPFLGESIPDYRAASAVPPVMPFLLSVAVRLVGDSIATVHLFAIGVLLALGVAAYLAAAAVYRSRMAGLIAVVAAFLLTDRFLELFAFGGLLQAGAIVFLLLAFAALARAGRSRRNEWRWWAWGGVLVGLAALTHVGTASIVVPTGVAIGLLSVRAVVPAWRDRLRRLAPMGVALLLVGIYWLFVLLPGGTELAQNPASLSYRGPARLLDGLTTYWPTPIIAGLAGLGLALGVRGERVRRAVGPWSLVATWTAVTITVVLAAVLSGAATDYPRFATPLLAPLCVAAGGAGAVAIGEMGIRLAARFGRWSPSEWALGAVAVLVIGTTWPAMIAFGTQANGYQMAAPASLQQAVTWIDGHVPAGSTVLAPVREGKWIEGLSGRAALFSSAVRYSFRPEEWRRSLAADTILRSGGAMANGYFFVRLTDDVTDASVPRGLAIGVNHGGEYVELLRLAPSGVRILDANGAVVATLPNLEGAGRTASGDGTAASETSTWSGERGGHAVTFRELISLRQDASTLELRTNAINGDPAPYEVDLYPSAVPLTQLSVDGIATAEFTFATVGSTAPQLRLVALGSGARLEALPDGGLRLHAPGGPVRLLLTDLSGTPLPAVGTGFLDPSRLVADYDVGAVLLVRDPAFDGRRVRLEALGFELGGTFGPYAVMVNR